MRFQCPFVSRRVFNDLRWQLNETKLMLSVANSETQHLCDRRMENVSALARAAMNISRLERKNRELRGELARQGTPA